MIAEVSLEDYCVIQCDMFYGFELFCVYLSNVSSSLSGLSGRMRALSLGSGGWDWDRGAIHLPPQIYTPPCVREERLWYVI